jgi:hypothetical protein
MSWKEEATMKISAMRLMLVAALGVASPALAVPNVTKVDCDRGQTIADALKHAEPGDTIRLTGTCNEQVVVTTDRLTIDGQGSAVLDGGGGALVDFTGVLTIDGAKGVRILGLRVRNGGGEGILGLRGAAFTAEHTIARDNATTGIAVFQGSTAELSNSAMTGNRLGLDVGTGSSVVLRDAITIGQNSINGVEINGEAVVELRAANVNASGNGGVGISVGSGQLAIFAYPATPASTLTANDNGFAGLIVGASRFTVYPAATVTASGNGVFGILTGGFVVTTIDSGSRFIIEHNAVGLRFFTGGDALIRGARLTVNGNGVGLQGDGAGVLTFVSGPAQASTITGNGTDVDLSFGSRAIFDGVAIGTLVTDGTVLCRGAGKPGCP